jgi:hypothetical protein
VQRLLKPLRPDGRDVGCACYPLPARSRVIVAARDGGFGPESYRDFRFASRVHNVLCNYFEEWKSSMSTSFVLQQANLSIHLMDRSAHTSTEIIAIHAEPSHIGSGPQAEFKRGPHVHVTWSQDPIPRCHFPLNYGHLKDVLSSLDSLTDAIKAAVKIASLEVLSRFDAR